MIYFVGFTGLTGLAGLAYLRYYEYSKINREVEQLMESNEIRQHLYETSQQQSFSIDSLMDDFEGKYNKSSISNYRQTLASLAAGKVLETCAGSNRNLRFYKAGLDLTLLDYSPNMVSVGSTKTSPLLNYKYELGDVMAMPFADDSYDCVVDTFGLEYVLNPHQALQEMRRVCRKDGRILLMNEGLSNILEFHYFENMKWGENLIRGGYFSNRNWEKLVKAFDFEVEHEERKKNGKLYIYVLRNRKEGRVVETA